jgi:valyl-tRNA synthetase
VAVAEGATGRAVTERPCGVLKHPAQPDPRQVEQHVAKASRNNSAAAFLSLAKLNNLERPTTEAATNPAVVQILEAFVRIKTICDLAHPAKPKFAECFIRLLSNRLRSSAHFAEYMQLRDHLLSRLTEISAEKHKQASEDHRRRRAVEKSDRNRQMAEAFRSHKSNQQHSQKSDSALKAEIGKRFELRSRSASIEAINRGLKSLSKQR